jgi:hypothetical protein
MNQWIFGIYLGYIWDIFGIYLEATEMYWILGGWHDGISRISHDSMISLFPKAFSLSPARSDQVEACAVPKVWSSGKKNELVELWIYPGDPWGKHTKRCGKPVASPRKMMYQCWVFHRHVMAEPCFRVGKHVSCSLSPKLGFQMQPQTSLR